MNTDQPAPELNRALLILEGLLCGITADDMINQKELEKLKNWKKLHHEQIKHHPVGDLMQMIDSLTGSRILPKEEKQFLLDFCQKYGPCEKEQGPYFCDLIRMEGFLLGILADKKIYTAEILTFHKWLAERPHLKQFERYEELDGTIREFLGGENISKENLYSYLEEMAESLEGNQ